VPFIANLYKFAVSIAILLAVIFIVWGGIRYMTTDVAGGKSAGKSAIQNALFGLIVVLGSFILLNTINPDLINLRMFGDVDVTYDETATRSYRTTGERWCVPTSAVFTNELRCFGSKEGCEASDEASGLFARTCRQDYPGVGPVMWCFYGNTSEGRICYTSAEGCTTAASNAESELKPNCVPVSESNHSVTEDFAKILLNEKETRERLCSINGVDINHDGCNTDSWCTWEGQQNCTNVGGLPEYMYDFLAKTAGQCRGGLDPNCTITITGGTEAGHETHDLNLPIIDIRDQGSEGANLFTSWLQSQIVEQIGAWGRVETTNSNGDPMEYFVLREGDHWHVCLLNNLDQCRNGV